MTLTFHHSKTFTSRFNDHYKYLNSFIVVIDFRRHNLTSTKVDPRAVGVNKNQFFGLKLLAIDASLVCLQLDCHRTATDSDQFHISCITLPDGRGLNCYSNTSHKSIRHQVIAHNSPALIYSWDIEDLAEVWTATPSKQSQIHSRPKK